jgi:hypothetical protein
VAVAAFGEFERRVRLLPSAGSAFGPGRRCPYDRQREGFAVSGLAFAVLLLVQAPTTAPPAAPPAAGAAPEGRAADRRSFARTLVVAEGETVEDALCFGCGIVVRGRVLGDTIAILGGVEVEGEAGASAAADVIAVGGRVHLAPSARVPSSLVAVGGPVVVDPGAVASYDVDALPWLHVPGQRQAFAEGASTLVAAVLALVALGAACVGVEGIAARDAALSRAPASRGLLGAALVAAVVCAAANGERLGRLEAVIQSGFGLALLGLVVAGAPGVASLAGRALARLGGRRLPAGRASCALGAAAIAILLLVPLVGAPVAVAGLSFAAGGAVARRATLEAPSDDEVPR